MTKEEYMALAMRSAKHMGSVRENLIHAALGLASDSGEFVDAVKKCCIYNKPLDEENCLEELGDILWFVCLAAQTLDITLEEIMENNIHKLLKRYPEGYSDLRAVSRLDKGEGQ